MLAIDFVLRLLRSAWMSVGKTSIPLGANDDVMIST